MDCPSPIAPPRADYAESSVVRVRTGVLETTAQTDRLAEETPIALEYNGISHATMLATPSDLEDFAIGFSLTEGIVNHPNEIRGIDLDPQPGGIVVQIEISSAREAHLKERRRTMAGRTGCGLCGVETLSEVWRSVPPVADTTGVSITAVLHAMRSLREQQHLHDITGATHAAAWADKTGQLAVIREDVGRHNALDKLIGALTRRQGTHHDGMILVSSRASFEMVQKCAAAGIGILAAVSAPTALAVRLARNSNVTLLGFVRQSDATIYTHIERIHR